MMKFLFKSLLILGCLIEIGFARQRNERPAIEPGVSAVLANSRKSMISDIEYQLQFFIPADKSMDIASIEHLTFNLKSLPDLLQLDFKQSPDHLKKVYVNGNEVQISWKDEHILIQQKDLKLVKNSIEIHFIAGNESLNRNSDFLYALFVPDHARTVFPCFDQPDLKARFSLALTVPEDWKVLANGLKKDSVLRASDTVYNFANSDLLPTYLFSFAAGKFTDLKKQYGHYNMEFLHRETDANKIKLSVDSVFIAHRDAISFLENWTGISFPFQKVGFVAIPDFQFGGMEHPGEVQYKSSSLFLDDGATKDQFISRSNLISHETAHMWFGDLVTMKWFNDVWMKEVFANFMADKVTENLMGKNTFDLKFLQDHYPAAYGIDRTLGANPIRQQLDNLQDAGSMYGNIIYHKAPIMMRQLEKLMGASNFQKGIREYLKKYAYQNATWNDLISILSKYSSADLYNWNKVWVNQPGRPVFDYKMDYNGNQISHFSISQHAEAGVKRTWPQAFSIKLFYANTTRIIPVQMKDEHVILKDVQGLDKPLFILFNADGMGYGRFPVDKTLMNQVFMLTNPLERASAYINAYENSIAGTSLKPDALLQLFVKGILREQNEMNLRLLTGYISSLYWNFTKPATRELLSPDLEKALWLAMEKQPLSNQKKILFGTYQNIYLSHEAAKTLYTIWQKQQAPAGVKLIDDDYTSLALTLALKTDTANTILKQQLERITNVDRKNRLIFLMPALSLNGSERDQFFYSLRERKNRQKESWVTSALSYLHHPLRQRTSEKYLPESLNLLEEIQKTGDIFFPQSWLSSIFGSYQTQEAYEVVDQFLKTHPNYNPKLKDKILQATDNLRRAKDM